MKTSRFLAEQKILKTAKNPKTMDQLVKAGIIKREFGITAYQSMIIVRDLVRSGKLRTIYDSCHMPTFIV